MAGSRRMKKTRVQPSDPIAPSIGRMDGDHRRGPFLRHRSCSSTSASGPDCPDKEEQRPWQILHPPSSFPIRCS
jgi:hypothetical protein